MDESLAFGDISPTSGFVDSYTSDPDRPSSENVVYLTYDDSIRTDDTKRRPARLTKSKNVKYTYVKMIDNKPIMVYKFYIKPEIRKLFSGHVELTPEQVTRVFEFWGFASDVSKYLCDNKNKYVGVEHNMPLEDYVPRFDIETKKGITI